MVKYIEKRSLAKKNIAKTKNVKKTQDVNCLSWQNGIKALRIQKYSLSELLLLTAKVSFASSRNHLADIS